MKDYKTLAEIIYKRKAVRDFADTPVDFLSGDVDLVQLFEVQPLVGGINVSVKVLTDKTEVKNKRSNYCLAFYSEEQPYYMENIGFIGQQIELELQSRGLGTCWWGMKKPKKDYKSVDGLDCVITMTAGVPKTKEERIYPDGFKRNKTEQIATTGAAHDKYIEAARIAPSAVNMQPWLIGKSDCGYDFYCKKPKGFIEKLIGDMRHVDMGIAMAHLFIQAKADGLDVSFAFDGQDIPQGKYIASILTRK